MMMRTNRQDFEQMADIFNEVDEALKAERAEEIWSKYGKHIIAGALLIVAATACFSAGRAWYLNRNETQTARLLAAQDEKDMPAAMQAVAADTLPGQKAVALLTAAGALSLDEKKLADALPLYEKVAADAQIPETLRDYATLMGVRLHMKLDGDKTDSAALLKELEPVWSRKDSPWKWLAHLDAAALLADGSRDYKAALDHVALVLGAEGIPDSLLQRARAMQHVYELRSAERKETEG